VTGRVTAWPERRRVSLSLLAAVLALIVAEAYWPFAWDPPGTVRNDVRRAPDGALVFGTRNAARTPTTPGWLAAARRGGGVRVELMARPAFPERSDAGPPIMMRTGYERGTDFCLGQLGRDLLFWLRRSGSDVGGAPPFIFADVFRPGHSTDVRIALDDDRIRVAVDGARKLETALAPGSLRTWRGGPLALGDEAHGGRGWQGRISRARVTVDGRTTDYLRPGALELPPRFAYLPDRVSPFLPASTPERLVLGLHLVSFVPVGFLLVWSRRRRALRWRDALVAVAVAFGIAILLAAGKPLFAYRHLAFADLPVQLVGAAIGAFAAAVRHRTGAAR
jgi:hypothetical protein